VGKVDELTNLLLLLLVRLAGLDGVLAGLGLGDGLLDGHVPAVTLERVLGLEGVLGAGDLEGKDLGAVLVEVGSVGLSRVSKSVIADAVCGSVPSSGHQRGAPSGRRA
jgi:hypothetical protein